MTDPAEKAIEEIIKRLPVKQVYDDGLSGATKQVGHSLTDVAKSIRLALFPFQFLAAIQDRVEKFIDRAIRRVPEEQRISPAPQVIGPVLEGIRYEPEGTPIDEMFSQLLSRAMDSKRVNEAHPAYPVLIRQLSEDEAKILNSLDHQQFDYVFTRDYNVSTALFSGMKVEVDDLPKGGLTFPENVSSILNTSTNWAWLPFGSRAIKSPYSTVRCQEPRSGLGSVANTPSQNLVSASCELV